MALDTVDVDAEVEHSDDSNESEIDGLDDQQDLGALASAERTQTLEPPPDHAREHVRVCTSLLNRIKDAIEVNPKAARFSSSNAWLQTVSSLLERNLPRTVIGVLGNTGVGKSSLLNALLNEASILPTSGSRGKLSKRLSRDH